MATSQSRRPPVQPPRFDLTPETLLERVQKIIDRSRTLQDNLVSSVKPEAATFTNTLLPIVDDDGHRQRESNILDFYQHIATSEDLRAASRHAWQLTRDFTVECKTREDVYRLVHEVGQRREKLDSESQKLLHCERHEFVLNGLDISSKQGRNRFVQVKKSIAQKCVEFRKNLVDGNRDFLWFTRQELEGVPENLLKTLEKGTGVNIGKLGIRIGRMSTATCTAIRGDTRRRLFIADANRCAQNASLLKSVIVLRDEAARLLGYSNHAELRLEDRMQRSVEATNEFLADVQRRLSDKGKSEIQAMLQFKDQDLKRRGEVPDGYFYLWDDGYYVDQIMKQRLNVDSKKISEYFPLDHTITGMLEIYKDLFGMTFDRINEAGLTSLAGGEDGSSLVWHKDVRLYSVWNETDKCTHHMEDTEFLGYLYLDLCGREGKIRGNSSFLLCPGFTDSNGRRWYPVTALACSFPAPTKTKPTLLEHSDVWFLFHELGHAIHDLVSKTRYARFHGTNVVQDFCEAPGQMLEYWCWTYSTLKTISRHYSTLSPEYLEAWKREQQVDSSGNTDVEQVIPREMPEEMLKDLIKTQKFNQALFWLSSTAISVFDMAIHTPVSHEEAEQINISSLYNRLRKEIWGIDGPESQGEGYEWGHLEANFDHLVGDYDAGYYSYISSKVYAADMFHSRFEADPMNKEEGRRYRRMILEKGGSMDETEMLTEYLTRAPSMDAFYREIGLET